MVVPLALNTRAQGKAKESQAMATFQDLYDELEAAFRMATTDTIHVQYDCPEDDDGNVPHHDAGCGCNILIAATVVEEATRRFNAAMATLHEQGTGGESLDDSGDEDDHTGLCECSDDDCPAHRQSEQCANEATRYFVQGTLQPVDYVCEPCAVEWRMAGIAELDPAVMRGGSV